jgi:hypothetical protein
MLRVESGHKKGRVAMVSRYKVKSIYFLTPAAWEVAIIYFFWIFFTPLTFSRHTVTQREGTDFCEDHQGVFDGAAKPRNIHYKSNKRLKASKTGRRQKYEIESSPINYGPRFDPHARV